MARRSPVGGRHGADGAPGGREGEWRAKAVSAFAAHASSPLGTASSSASSSSRQACALPRSGSRTPELATPCAKFSSCLKRVEGEDLVFVREGASMGRDGQSWSLFCVCDGNNGRGAALYIKDHLWSVLAPLLPRTRLPEDYGRDFRRFSKKVSTAIAEALLEIGEQYAAHTNDMVSGATLTLALLCGRLLTIANIGDSKAVLDTGTQSLLATVSHRLEDNKRERRRLAEAGAVLATGRSDSGAADPLGGVPDVLRCYPGGLPFSRTIGNVEAGKHIVACPHICQVVIPKCGLRLLIGSSGLWNMIGWSSALEAIENTNIKAAAATVVGAAVKHCGHSCKEDTTALVLDVVAPEEDPVKESVTGSVNGEEEKTVGCRGLVACLFGYSEAATAEKWTMARDALMVVSRADGLDIAKTAVEQSDSRLSRLASGALPSDDSRPPCCSSTREWAPAFLTAQRATLGLSSSASKWAPIAVPPAKRPRGPRGPRLSSCFTGESF